jgi:hypothetical protein
MRRELGKLPAVFDQRTLRLENYMDIPKLPPLPETSDWFAKASKFPMYKNDEIGNCAIAAPPHMIQTWTANAGRHEQIIDEKTIVDTYFELTSGQDSGLNMLEVLKYWRKAGIAGHKIGAFAAIDPQNIISLRYANYLFGGLYMGFLLPTSCEKQKVWDVPRGGPVGDGTPGSWGGHAVNGGVTTPRIMKVGTWGMEMSVTMNFVGTYSDESYAIISLEWFTTEHKTPSGFYWKDLLSDLKNRVVTGR